MSKKNRYEQLLPTSETTVPVPPPMSAPANAPMGSEARIQYLEAELQKALEATAKRVNEVLDLRTELESASTRATTAEREAEEWEALATEANVHAAKLEAVPVVGHSSARAKELVDAVPPHERLLLLGDLLDLLAPHVGETGANETALDVLHRLVEQVESSSHVEVVLREGLHLAEQHRDAAVKRAETIQAAMVARRSPDAGAGVDVACIRDMLTNRNRDATDPTLAVARALQELDGLRSFLSPAPLVALAVRDDSTPQVRERYSLHLLEWDGKTLTPSPFEQGMPWVDIAALATRLFETRLVPEPFRK